MLFDEYYSISRPMTGDAKIKNLALTGWGNAPTKMELGRIYWKSDTSNVLQLYTTELNRDADASEIAFGTISGELVTLAAANSSGISGTATVVHTAGTAATGTIQVTYAVEADLLSEVANLTSLLDGSSQWEGVARFEKPLRESKLELDQMLIAKLHDQLFTRSDGAYDLTAISNSRMLARIHAKLAAAYLFNQRAVFTPEYGEMIDRWRSTAGEMLDNLKIIIDRENDDTIDTYANVTTGRMRR